MGINIEAKIKTREALAEIRKHLSQQNKSVVFTNGCFDILHRGHVEYLQKSRDMGDALIVGLNSDDSVTRLKGKSRPLLPQEAEPLPLPLVALLVIEGFDPLELDRR